MNLSTPKNITFYVACALAAIGLIGYFVAALAPFATLFALAGFAVLAAGNLLENL